MVINYAHKMFVLWEMYKAWHELHMQSSGKLNSIFCTQYIKYMLYVLDGHSDL